MASFVESIRAFQNGTLPPDALFDQVDHLLMKEQGSSAQLLELLAQEHATKPLQSDVHAELQRRIRRATAASPGSDETRVQTNPAHRWRAASSDSHDELAGTEADRMKGVGDTLNGRFVLEECIGFGGMGTVYRALDLRKLEASDRKPYIAIKVLNVQFRGHPKSLIALQREARKAQTLAHPNIVTVYDFDRDGAMVYLTMEYLSGKPLSHTLRMPGFAGMPLADALPIINGMGRALGYAHERGFVHCDFKPANVILTDKGEVKVIDFGIARMIRKSEEEVEATVFDAGSLGGLTPAYASPEMLEHLEPDPRDDIYALACITHELLTGRHPFDRLSAIQARSAGMRVQRPKNMGLRQWRALKAALSFDRATRTPTVSRFLQEMNGERRATKHVWVLVGSLLIGTVVAGGMFYYWDRQLPVVQISPTAPAAPQAVPETTSPTLSIHAVNTVLARIPCSALVASVREKTIQVRGYLPQRVGIAGLKNRINAVPGVQSVDTAVQIINEVDCDIINTLAPYWLRHQQAGQIASIQVKAQGGVLTEGDPLMVDIVTPGYASYVYVDYYVLDGTVAHLIPNTRTRANQAPPSYTATIGSLGNWVIAKPFGTELIVFISTPTPLFDKVRPEVESRGDYLQALQTQLAQLRSQGEAERVVVDFTHIMTKARSEK